jgi:hypothetical protein
MGALAGSVTSARLTFKVHRFEVLAVSVGSLIVAVSALIVTYRLDAVGVTAHCLVQWMSGGPDAAGVCKDPVARWAGINESEGGKVLAAMALLPYAVGLFLGVPLVGRELEAGTAAMAWGLTGSRSRWLLARVAPVILLAVALAALTALTAAVLETTRTGDGLWSNLYQDAELFGAPVVAHALAGLGIGLLVGAVMGRTLPALIVGGVAAIVLFNVGQQWHESFLPASAYGNQGAITTTSVQPKVGPPPSGADLADAAARVMDPDLDYRFQTPDGQLLTRETAVATVPAGTTSVGAWLVTHDTPIFEGPSATLTGAWQLRETIAFGLLGGLLILLTFPVVERARPT